MAVVWHPSYLADITEDCWRRAGIGADMRVLDAGCGTGESTLLAARIVGPSGTVIGLERDHAAVRAARTAADDRWVENVEFREGEIGSLAWFSEAPFDAVVGRGFLVEQSDPAQSIRELSRLVRPGGVIAFLEEELEYSYCMEPSTPFLNQAVDRLQLAARERGRQLHVVSSFPRLFLEAGLGWPSVRAYQAAGGSGSQIWSNFAAAVAGAASEGGRRRWEQAEQIDTGTLAREFQAVAQEQGSAWVSPPTAGAWARVTG